MRSFLSMVSGESDGDSTGAGILRLHIQAN